MFALALGLSIAGLSIGPALVHWARGRTLLEAALDGVVLGLIPALVIVRVLPHLAAETGAMAIVLFAAGYLGICWIERRSHRARRRVGVDLVMPALLAHAFTDGAALAVAYCGTSSIPRVASGALVAALILHKVPEGLFVASTLLPTVGMRATIGRISLIAAATLVGALGGQAFLGHASETVLHALVAVGLGVMLRVVVHRHGIPECTPRARSASAVCFLASLALALIVQSPERVLLHDPRRELSFLTTFCSLGLWTAPLLLASVVVAVVVRTRLTRLVRRDDEHGRCGPPFLTENGPPLLLIIAARECSLPAIVVSQRLVGPAFTVARVMPALLLVLIGCLRRAPLRYRAQCILEGVFPQATITLRDVAAGFGIAATMEALTPDGVLSWLRFADVSIAAAAGSLLSSGPIVSAPLSAMVVHKGASLPATLAFALGATWCSFSIRRHLRTLRTPSAAWAFTVGSFLLVVAYSSMLGPMLTRQVHASLHELASTKPRPLEWTSATILATWTAVHVFRHGPRAWLSAVTGPTGHEGSLGSRTSSIARAGHMCKGRIEEASDSRVGQGVDHPTAMTATHDESRTA